MDPCAALVDKLKHRTDLRYEASPGFVRIAAPTETGFSLELRAEPEGWTVFLGEAGFHESFTAGTEVLNFIAWCFSGEARLREVWRGNSPQNAVLEAHEHGEWYTVSETGYFLVPFWRARREVTLQNPNLLSDS